MNVTALPTDATVSSTNAVDTAAENTHGQTGVDDAAAPFTIEPLTLDTSVTKSITPETIWGVPGTTADVTLTGNVTPESNAGSERLVISDPADPAGGRRLLGQLHRDVDQQHRHPRVHDADGSLLADAQRAVDRLPGRD